ncbi:MAG: hypothetical protein QGG23_01045 [Candidatus Bathyarchaeota archaeon]|nr:hypothetical protein [Candidatus Bathyarchaeota archaeon]
MNNVISSRPVSYTINGDGIQLDIALVEINKLLLHEETIQKNVDELFAEIERTGILKSPVIVGREFLVVLDGMHRVEVLKNMGCRFMCVCLVDYMSPRIKIDRWCRVVLSQIPIEEIITDFGDLGVVTRTVSSASEGESLMLMLEEGYYKVTTHENGIISGFATVTNIEAWLRRKGHTIRYETERDATRMLKQREAGFVLCPPAIQKKHVIEISISGSVFPPKATRHIIPARPFGIDVPIELLKDKVISIAEANRQLSILLENKSIRRIPPGYRWGSRRYEEAIYLFK